MKQDITSKIERMPALEERTGLRFDALYAETELLDGGYTVSVRGEAHATSGGEIDRGIDIVLGVYDDEGRLVATTNTWLNDESFYAFETIDLICFDVASSPQRLRIYPKLS